MQLDNEGQKKTGENESHFSSQRFFFFPSRRRLYFLRSTPYNIAFVFYVYLYIVEREREKKRQQQAERESVSIVLSGAVSHIHRPFFFFFRLLIQPKAQGFVFAHHFINVFFCKKRRCVSERSCIGLVNLFWIYTWYRFYKIYNTDCTYIHERFPVQEEPPKFFKINILTYVKE